MSATPNQTMLRLLLPTDYLTSGTTMNRERVGVGMEGVWGWRSRVRVENKGKVVFNTVSQVILTPVCKLRLLRGFKDG